MKTSTTLLFLVASLAACHTMTAPVEDDVQVGQAMYSFLIASADDRVCTLEDHLETMRNGISSGCTFCQAIITDDVVAAVNAAVVKGPVPGPEEPLFTYGMIPDLKRVSAMLIDSRGQKVVYTDYTVRGFDGILRQSERFDKDYNVIWTLSDEITEMDKYVGFEPILQACTRAANAFFSR